MRFLLCWIGFISISLAAQPLSGTWTGQVWQAASTDTFSYQVQLLQDGNALSGEVQTNNANGQLGARFLLTGRVLNDGIQLQEIEQLSPETPQWCLKFIDLAWENDALLGSWTAKGCQPGFMRLSRDGTFQREQAFSYVGRWIGSLGQSDRDYGFYYEMNLSVDGTGSSHIVSEGAGGEATHQLRWEETADGIQFTEQKVTKRTEGAWVWCVKAGTLQRSDTAVDYQLQGDWSGYLENKSPSTGACAPGELVLTKPVLSETVQVKVNTAADHYAAETERTVKVDRVIQVKSDNVRIKVWDNGIVDGDVLTLFLNGQRILKNYRVNKRKWSIPVDIIDGENLLILHAEDLGDISPNTVAVSINDGLSEQIIILSSNLAESGAILIQPFVLD